MFHAFKILITTAAVAASGVVIPPSENPTTSAQARVVITGMTQAERVMTMHAIDLFAQAGLPLPPLEIRRHHHLADCHGHEGLHRRKGDASVIDVCTSKSDVSEQRMII